MRLRYKASPVAFAIIVLLIFGVTPRAAAAQTTGLGALHGQVLDPSGGAVVGASVVLTTPTGDALVATTDQQGIFDRKGLAPGKYSVQIIAKGFAIYKNDDVEIAADKVAAQGHPGDRTAAGKSSCL